MTSFNSLLLPPAAVGAARPAPAPARTPTTRRSSGSGPAWLNGVLEQPLRLEARWLARGGTLPAGLSLLAVLRTPDGRWRRTPP